MKRTLLVLLPVVGVSVLSLSFQPASAQGVEMPPKPTYANVARIMKANCIKCHGAEKAREGLRLDSYEAIMKGGEHGPVVLKGNPAKSRLMRALKGDGIDMMPPKKGPLPKSHLAIIEGWIRSGAPKK